MGVLSKAKTYLIGGMEFVAGQDWRLYASGELQKLNITVFNPYIKPFVTHVDESDDARADLFQLRENEEYDRVAKHMSQVRSFDLSLVDRSDFLIAHIEPRIASWGSAEEIVQAVKIKRPIFLSVEGGKKKTPLWLLGSLPHKYIYGSIEESIAMIKKIDSGEVLIDSDRWRLLLPEYR